MIAMTIATIYRTGPLIAVVGIETRVELEADSMNFLFCLLKPD